MISEWAVVLLAAALYLFDCCVLLERGQALLSAGLSGPKLTFGSRHYVFRGRTVAILNPLTPYLPSFRTLPLLQARAAAGVLPSQAFRALAPVAILCGAQFVLLFVALPYCLFRAPGWPLLASLLLAYLNALAMLVLIALRMGAARIARRPLIGLGFGWLACIPLSVNCMRAAGLSFDLTVDAARAMRFLSPQSRRLAAAALGGQIEEALLEMDERDADRPKLFDLQQQLVRSGERA